MTPTPTTDPPQWVAQPVADADLAPPGVAPEVGYPDSTASHDCTGDVEEFESVDSAVDVVLPDPSAPFFGVERFEEFLSNGLTFRDDDAVHYAFDEGNDQGIGGTDG